MRLVIVKSYSRMNQRPDDAAIEERNLTASYNARDLILYAISCGFGSHGKADANFKEFSHSGGSDQLADELQYLYEHHRDFSAVPTFCLALPFWAHQIQKNATSYNIPPFPPPSMSATALIPKKLLRNSGIEDSSTYPILHMWQSIQWNETLPVPSASSATLSTNMKCRILTVAPKKIGTFVTSETKIVEEASQTLICTQQSTTLVLGIPPANVIARDVSSSGSRNVPAPGPTHERAADYEFTYKSTPTQALLYRLASGDSNRIHVLGDDLLLEQLGLGKEARKPILHGLCTFGIATRAILQYVSRQQSNLARTCSTERSSNSNRLTHLEGSFKNPVFIEDILLVKIWNISSQDSGGRKGTPRSQNNNNRQEIVFQVHNLSTGTVAVDQGYAKVSTVGNGLVSRGSFSRL